MLLSYIRNFFPWNSLLDDGMENIFQVIHFKTVTITMICPQNNGHPTNDTPALVLFI